MWLRRAVALVCGVLFACGARTELDTETPDGGGRDGGAAGSDGGIVISGLCSVERRVAAITGGLNTFPTLARGSDALMLAFTRETGTRQQIFAVPIWPRGDLLREPRLITPGHGGTIGALLDGTTFGLLYLEGSVVTGVELRPDTSITGDPRSYVDTTAQQQPALAIGEAALGFGWTTTAGDTSRLFMGDDDSGRKAFTEVVIEGHDVHAAQLRSAAGRIRFLAIVDDVAQIRTFSVDGTMVSDIATVGLMGGGRVQLGAAVANRTDDGVVVAGTDASAGALVGMLHERRTRRIEAPVGAMPLALDGAADPRERGWMLAAVSWGGPESPILELYATNGTVDEVIPLGETGAAAHPTLLAPARADEPFLLAYERGSEIEIARVFCAR